MNLSEAQELALAELTDKWQSIRKLKGCSDTFAELCRSGLAECKWRRNNYNYRLKQTEGRPE